MRFGLMLGNKAKKERERFEHSTVYTTDRSTKTVNNRDNKMYQKQHRATPH